MLPITDGYALPLDEVEWLLYKQGFNPQPHIQFAAPLGVGITGVREIVDFLFSPPVM